jgi:hypothetical protein
LRYHVTIADLSSPGYLYDRVVTRDDSPYGLFAFSLDLRRANPAEMNVAFPDT